MRHVGIVVNDIEFAINFWQELFGYEVEKDQLETGVEIDKLLNCLNVEVRTVKMIHKTNARIELLKFNQPIVETQFRATPFSKGITHLAFAVNNLDETLQKLNSLGGSILGKSISKDGASHAAYCYAFEGIILEIVEMKN